MQDVNRFKLGLFICFTFILFVGILVFLGMMDRFRNKAQVMTIVSESVQGLSVGSSVKYQGVDIGKVSKITIAPESRMIRILMELNMDSINMSGKNMAQEDVDLQYFYSVLKKSVRDSGLRCKLCAEGITGMKYIEFEYLEHPPENRIMEIGFAESDIFYIPSVPSLLKDLQVSAVSIIDKLNAVDYQGLARKLENTLTSADEVLTSRKLDNILTNIDTAASGLAVTVNKLNNTLTEKKINDLLANSEKTMTAVHSLSDTMTAEIEKAKIQETSQKLRLTLDSFRANSRKFTDTMNKIDSSVDALVELIQMLDNDPSSIIRGKAVQKDSSAQK